MKIGITTDSPNRREVKKTKKILEGGGNEGTVDEAEQRKWYAKEKFMLDWVNKFSPTHCVHPSFAISIDEMMKIFKGLSNMTHRMKKKPIKEGFKFYAMVCALSGYCFFFFPDGLKEKKKRGIADAVVFMV